MTDEIQENTAVAEQEPIVDDLAVAEESQSAPQAAKLVLKRGGVLTDIAFEIHSPATIGRFDPSVGPIDVDLAAQPEGAYVSRKHAKIIQADGVWKVVDLGSSNGTFVLRDDFERVEEAELTDGQEFALGNARFVFQLAAV
jgi:pSer/pThr/pTyr-binding forkhead associated (FHA) protein